MFTMLIFSLSLMFAMFVVSLCYLFCYYKTLSLCLFELLASTFFISLCHFFLDCCV